MGERVEQGKGRRKTGKGRRTEKPRVSVVLLPDVEVSLLFRRMEADNLPCRSLTEASHLGHGVTKVVVAEIER
jgi:hypothetical protein